MVPIIDQAFNGVSVNIDGNAYQRCQFSNCTLVYSGGRYPNRRITQEGLIFRSIHVAMADQPDGQRFDHFFPEIPYTIFGGAWIDDGQTHKRWHSVFLNSREIPFSLLLTALPLYLDHYHDYLAHITEDHIYAWACTTSLG